MAHTAHQYKQEAQAVHRMCKQSCSKTPFLPNEASYNKSLSLFLGSLTAVFLSLYIPSERVATILNQIQH